MTLIGQSLQTYKGLSTPHLLRFAKTFGIQSCEINATGTNHENVAEIISEVGNMPLTFHLPVEGVEGFDLSHKEKEKEVQSVIKLINDNHVMLNIVLGVFHPPQKRGDFQTLVENLNQLEIPVVVENVPDYSNLEFKALYLKFKDNLNNNLKGWLFDVAHSYLRNGKERYMDLLDILPFNELEEIHFSDCLEGEDSHYAFGSGVLPIDSILTDIRSRKYDKIIVNEINPYPTVWDLLDSYIKVAKYFNKRLYTKTRIKRFIFRPIVQKKLEKAGIH